MITRRIGRSGRTVGARQACSGTHDSGEVLSLAVLGPMGDVEAVGMVGPADEGGRCPLTLEVVGPGDGGLDRLIEALTSEARAMGCRRLVTVTPRDSGQILESLAAAGCQIVSALNLGGATEFELSVGGAVPA